MSEKKYYVKLKNTYKHDEKLLSLNKVSGKIDFVDWRNSGAWWKGNKSQLAEIMDGALYKGHEPMRNTKNMLTWFLLYYLYTLSDIRQNKIKSAIGLWRIKKSDLI
ncbi:hypothetical protein RZO31_12740 [Lactococcus lactis]|uniref:Uncharacterized protein n=1 Tax=Lactococcus lactis TaxID=1358 RepID=A0AAE4NST9_9LACT|nr:hypothetical protein [Lactococcus lactis]MDV2633715.1 hypothetical protein [Lactococcus lactis]